MLDTSQGMSRVIIFFFVYTMAETNLCLPQRRYAGDQTRQAYRALNEQFDLYTGVIWQPYTQEVMNARYPTVCLSYASEIVITG